MEDQEIDQQESPQQDTNAQPQEEAVSPKRTNKRLIIISVLLVVAIIAGLIVATYYYLRNTNDATPSVEEQSMQVEPTQSSKLSVLSLENGEVYGFDKTGAATKLFDIQPRASYEQFTSPAGSFVSSSTDKGIEIRHASETDTKVVFEKPADVESLSYMWLDDESGLLVRTTRTEKELNSTTRVQMQEFYRVKIDGTDKTKLFEHTETNGSAALVGVNVARDEFYWHVVGEGGPREFLNVSKLSDGTVVKKHTAPNTNYDIAIGSDVFITVIDDGKQLIDQGFLKDEPKLLSTTLGISGDILTGSCNKSEIVSSPYYEKANNSVFYTLTSNVLNKTVVQFVPADAVGQPIELYALDGVREHKVVYADASLFVIERSNKDALCTGTAFVPGEPVYDYVVVNRNSKEIEALQIPAGQRIARFGLLAK